MKKRVFKLAVSITKLGNTKRTNKTISSYINRIPCREEDLTTKSYLQQYINDEMSQYPSPNQYKETTKNKVRSVEKKLKNIINRSSSKQQRLEIIIERLRNKLEYCDLEQALNIIKQLGPKEDRLMKKKLDQIGNNIGFILKTSQNVKHIRQIADQVLKVIEKKKRSNLL